MIALRFLLISSLASISLGSVEAEPVSTDKLSFNLFGQALEVREGMPQILPAGEDLSSPFTRAHDVEQSMYTSAYRISYGARSKTYFEMLKKLPDALDNEGRPLWFDGGTGRMELMWLVQELYVNRQFQDLDRLLDDWNKPSEKMADGRWKLAIFENALTASIGVDGLWDMNRSLLDDWKEKFPKSRAGAFAQAIYWRNYAWDARGQGWARDVTRDRWALFHDRLKKAEQVLLESKSFASDNPLWGRFIVQVGSELDWPREEVLSVFHEEIAKNESFQPGYVTMIRYSAPKWAGSWEAVDALVSEAVKNGGDDGASLYARLYWQLAREENLENEGLFSETKANWPKMKASFEDMIRLYPHSAHNLNTFAAVACIANDKATFADLRSRIGNVVTRDSWPKEFSLDFCEHKFGTGKL